MADASLQAESVCANPTIHSLYAAFMCAKAEWDLMSYSPEYFERDLPRDLEAKFCSAHSEALNKMMLHPSADASDLALKMSVYRDEDLVDRI